jgi:type III restriction enzyme
MHDFFVQVDDGQIFGYRAADPLHLTVIIKGYRSKGAREKANTMRSYWVPA